MHLMAINRRQLLQSGLLLAGETVMVSGLYSSNAFADPLRSELYAAARRNVSEDKANLYSAVLFTTEGDVRSVTLPDRGHDVAVRPGHAHSTTVEVVAFARRPGRFAVAFTLDRSIHPLHFFARKDRHFYGHGLFSPQGKLLYTTENDYENGKGVIGIRDATDGYKQIGEFSTFGIGPHDMALLDDGVTLVIANGGMETSPDTGRRILNITEMEPSLVYVDRRTGTLIEKQSFPLNLRQLSIRHLTVAGNNRVVFGCQYKGPKTDTPNLVGMHDRGRPIQLIETPDDVLHDMKHYIGSVTADSSGEIIAASSPRGGFISYWDASNKTYIGRRELKDGCGLARTQTKGAFLQTSGLGRAEKVSIDKSDQGKEEQKFPTKQWDNHAVFVR